jgi:AraC-like DNA-binding protein
MIEDTVSPERSAAGQGEQATIRLLFLTALVNALSATDNRIEPLLRDHGFFTAQMATPFDRAPLHRYVALIEHAADKFGRPFLGLEMGARFGLTELGLFQALLRAAGTVRAALDSLALFQSRLQTKTLLDTMIGVDVTTYSYRIEDPAIWPRRQDAEFTIAGIVTLVRQLTTPKWSPAKVHFEHSVSGREEQLAPFFRAPLRGNQVANQLVIRNDDLDRPFPSAMSLEDGKLRSILECHLLDLMGPGDTVNKGFVAQARDLIARRLGRTHVDCASIAAEFNLSGRSLRRRLMEEGTSFRTLLQDARKARASAMLQASDLPLSAAAEQLGYSDTATFSRAFKDWTGVSPGRYAKKA